MPWQAALYNRRKWELTGKSQWCCSANCGHPLHALTYNWTHCMQLANTPPLQSTTPGLHPVSFHQMAPPVRGNTHLITAYYSVYRPRKDERLSQPGWLVTYRNKVPPSEIETGHVTHPSTLIYHAASVTNFGVVKCRVMSPGFQLIATHTHGYSYISLYIHTDALFCFSWTVVK